MIKKIFKLTLFLIILLISFFYALISYPCNDRKKLQDIIMKYSSKALLKLFNVKVNYDETNVFPKNTVIVCNHISYLDIPILLSYFKGRFVAIKEIKKWPVLGWTIAMLGHIFIERGKKESYEKINNAVKDNIIIIFPEGHTSTGKTIKKFKDGAFVAAMKNKAPILPVVIKYNKKEVAWYGNTSLIPHLWKLCALKIEAVISVGKIIDSKSFNATWALREFTRERMLELYKNSMVRYYGR